MTKLNPSNQRRELEQSRSAPLQVPTQLGKQASTDITGSMNALLAAYLRCILRPGIFIGI